MRELPHTKHKYGHDFPHFKRLQLDEFPDIDKNEDESITASTVPFAQPSKMFETIPINERAIAIIKSLLECVGAKLFVSDFVFMLASDRSADIIPAKWAYHFDKMKGIIREPGLLIVQIPQKNTSLSVPTWYKSTNSYLRFIDSVYVCRVSCLQLSQETFSDVLGGSEQKLAKNLHAILIASLSILSIAGGAGLVEKLVMAIRDAKLDPIQIALPCSNVFTDWQIGNRCQCPCNPDSTHRPLSPIAAAKAVGIDIWRERQEYFVNRVWDLHHDKLIGNIDVRDVIFVTHRWSTYEIEYQDVRKKKRWLGQTISRMSEKLRRIRNALIKHTKYVWIDIICIDKSNLSELDEVIRSMYKWYSSCAAVVLDSGTTLNVWRSRGWCLQEGAAAGVLRGISKGGKIATIQELAKEQNQELCTLDLHLYYRPGNAAEILARMDVRKTARDEDMAYALAGIFSIDLTLAYGEGHRSRVRLLHQLAIQKGDLSFLSFPTTRTILHNYLPAVSETNYLISKCTRASAPITVSHFGMCFEVQLVKGSDARQLIQKLDGWIKMSFAKGRFLGVEELIKAGEQSVLQSSSSVELAIVHDIRSLILVQVYGQDMQTGGGNPIKLCYRLQCCQMEETEFERLLIRNVDEPKKSTAASEGAKSEEGRKVHVANEGDFRDGAKFERIWLGDKPDSAELNLFRSESTRSPGLSRQ
jgi:Heterokaryon incompatibility protein (HET)